MVPAADPAPEAVPALPLAELERGAEEAENSEKEVNETMGRIYIRRSKRNPDFWEVVGGTQKNVQVRTKTKAKEIAAARRRVRDKRSKR